MILNRAQPMESCILLTYRHGGEPLRLANLMTVLQWLSHHTTSELLVLEQDAYPSLPAPGPEARWRVAFAYNPGPFNKAWGLNVAARLCAAQVLVFCDADLIVPQTLPKAVQLCQRGYAMVKPYRRLYDLGEQESAALRAGELTPDGLDLSTRAAGRAAIGEHLVLCGGAFAIRRDAFDRLGGWDERFVGWGGEDDAMSYKLERRRLSTVELDEAPALHLWHPRPLSQTGGQAHYPANMRVLQSYRALEEAAFERLLEVQQQLCGHREKYRPRAPG